MPRIDSSGPTAEPASRSGEAGLITARQILVAIGLALALTLVFWLPLWTGGGLIGSDVYQYFLPQKAFYAAQLRAGALPVWNNLIGWGYPQLAESQTGALYPINLALYRFLDLNTAYNAGLILHYVLAFAFMWLYARELRLSAAAAALAALVYVYGWFPVRVCLEWAIVGGAWLPAALWCTERCLRTRLWRYAIALTFVLAGQMLAGHFTLAFVTQVVLAAYIPLRLCWARERLPQENRSCRAACGVGLTLAIFGAFALAAAQLFPTWELQQNSQRQDVSVEHDPAYGYIPWRYLAQTVTPWYWYADEEPFRTAMTRGGPRTNRVEAHLYFGLIPLALAAWGVWRDRHDRLLWLWVGLGALATVHTTGALIPLTRHLPGFSFFEGPGRFGIVSTLAVALLAGRGLASLLHGRKAKVSLAVLWLVFVLSTVDLWVVSRPGVLRALSRGDFFQAIDELPTLSRELTFVFIVRTPVIDQLPESTLRQILAAEPQPVRLFSEGKNLPSLLGISTLPTYLGLGPEQYFEPRLMYPGALDFAAPPSAEQITWLRNAGVTHLLSFVPLENSGWPARRLWSGGDSFLNPALARPVQQPLYLYRLEQSRGRFAWVSAAEIEPPVVSVHTARRIVARVNPPHEAMLILTELPYPGWEATIDGSPAASTTIDGIYRAVRIPAGSHEIVWNYRAVSLYWGAAVSMGALVLLLTIGHIRFWHPHAFHVLSGVGGACGTVTNRA